MSNGQSKAPYIIICDGRIDVLNAKDDGDKLAAASSAATRLVSFYDKRVTGVQTAPVSDLQHEMMDNFNLWNSDEVDAAVSQMFALLDDLEDQVH